MKIKSSRGFSLTEVIVVLALVAVAASIAVPNLNSYRYKTNLKEAARDISSDISLYRQRAVSENRGYQIQFSAAENKYRIYNEAVLNSGNYNTLIIEKVVGAGNANIVISGTPSFSGGVPNVTLNQRGTSGAGSLTLQHNKSLLKMKITTNLMGRVKVEYDN